MDAQHLPKRRKLSPDAVPDGGKPSSILSRASFYTPTKASLARFNPNLLLQKPPKQVIIPEHRRRNSIPLRPNSKINGRLADDEKGPPRRTHRVIASRNADKSQTSPIRDHSVTSRPSASPTRRQNSLHPRQYMDPISPSLQKSPSKQRAELAPNPPASPPPAADEGIAGSQEASNAQQEPELQANTPSKEHNVTPTARAPKQPPRTQPNGEPDLPLSPVQLGLEPVPEAPKGMLFSSPRRPRRRKTGVQSSPLRQADARPDVNLDKAVERVGDESLVQVEDSQAQSTQQGSQALTQDTQANTEDPELRKQRLVVEQLQTQVSALSSDISFLETEINRFQEPESQPQASQESNAKLLSILTSKNPTHIPPDPPPPPPPPLSIRLAAFLPFAKAPTPPRSPSPEPLSLPPIIGHHPITLADPLPYLQAFTPFTITLGPPTLLSSDSQHLTQNLDQPSDSVASGPHVLLSKTLTLVSPFSLLSLSLALNICLSKDTESIDSLTLSSISDWADSDLGAWIRETSPTCDVSCIGWGAGRYWEVVRKRAEFWAWCRDEFADFIPEASSERDKISRNKGKQKAVLPNQEPGSSAQEAEAESPDPPLISSELQDLIPKRSISLLSAQTGASLLFSWRVSLSAIGEPESRVSVRTALPRSWIKVDRKKSLGKIGELYQRLLAAEYGVRAATETVVRLVLGEDSAESGKEVGNESGADVGDDGSGDEGNGRESGAMEGVVLEATAEKEQDDADGPASEDV